MKETNGTSNPQPQPQQHQRNSVEPQSLTS